MKQAILILIISINFTFAQDTASICKTSVGLGLTGEITGTYWANFISLDSTWLHDADLYATRYFVSESMIDSTASLHIVNCMEAAEACTDRYIPGIAVLGDSSIRDEEWNENYADVLTDSAAFFTMEAMMLYQKFGVYAADDCGIDSFYVRSLEIEPPGGVDRPSGTRTFRIKFRAVDFAGRVKEAQMVWVRDNTGI